MLDNGQAALGFGAYSGLLFRAANFANLTAAPEQNMKKALLLIGVTTLLCLPAAILTLVVQSCLNSLTVLQAMLLGRLIPIFYASFVLVALSEYVAINLKLFELKLTMYRRMSDDEDDCEAMKRGSVNDLKSFDLFPDLVLVQVGTSKKRF